MRPHCKSKRNRQRRHRRQAFRRGERLEPRLLLAQFVDITSTVGLGDYVASTGDGHGPGAVFADLNNDDYPDLYVVRSGVANELYINTDNAGQRAFEQVSDGAGAGNTGSATGAIAGDYDNDGDLDLFVINFNEDNALLQNQFADTGELRFVDVTQSTDPTPEVADEQYGLRTATWDGHVLDNSLTAAWGDPDRDGDLDLFVGNHDEYFRSPFLAPGQLPGQRDIFYRNNGDGTFSDMTMEYSVPGYETETGATETTNQYFSSSNAAIFADFDNDQWPDLFVTNKVGGPDDRDLLYMNQGVDNDGNWLGFAPQTYNLPTTFGNTTPGAMGVAVADFENDGDLDIYITDWSNPSRYDDLSSGSNDIWINQLSETGQLDFVQSLDARALFSWGVQWEDFDNDGFQDLHVATERNIPDFYYSNNDGVFVDESAAAGFTQQHLARGDVAADFDRDGRLDLFVVNIDGGPSAFYENQTAAALSNHFLSLKLVGNPDLPGPLRSTRDALGARVTVRADLDGDGVVGANETMMREVVSGSSNAASTSSLPVEFGLGRAEQAEVTVNWPSGLVTELGHIAADEFVVVHERRTTVGSRPANPEANLIVNPGFESGDTASWTPQGSTQIVASSTTARQGAFSGHVSNRTANWNGIGQSLLGVMQPGTTYRISVWVKLDSVDGESIGLTLQQTDGSGTNWTPIEWSTGSQSEWVELSGSYTLSVTGPLTTLFLYVEGPNPGVDFFVDDMVVEAVDETAWEAAANQRIEEIRKRDVRVVVQDANGHPLPGASIEAMQTGHGFGFGSTINSFALPNAQYQEFFRNNFEWGVMEFEAKWHETEQIPGVVNYSRADSIVDFAEANDIELRGHTIFWDVEQFVPQWVRGLTGSQLRAAMESRLNNVVNHFQGTFHHWDVINEMLHGSFYEDRLAGIRAEMFAQAKAVDPDVELFVNDYEIITGGRADDYLELIQSLIADGAPIDGIGVQGHFPAAPTVVPPPSILDRLDVLAPLGLPVWVTEFDVQDPNVNARADRLESAYRAIFSHPAVDGILMWGFWAGAHWRGADASLVDMDWSVNAAGQRYQELLAEWTTEVAGGTDENGAFDFRGFHGTYDVVVSLPGHAPFVQEVEVADAAGRQVVRLTLDAIELPSVALTVDPVEIAETNGMAVVSAQLSHSAIVPVVIEFGFGGTASPSDYQASATQVTIPAGATSGTITVSAVTDVAREPDETIDLDIASVVGAVEDGSQQQTIVILDDDRPETFHVVEMTVTDSGFVAEFSHSLDTAAVNLYETSAGVWGPSDVRVEGSTVGHVDGSLVIGSEARSITFVQRGGPLEADSYTVVMRSGDDGFKSTTGLLLDGDADGTPGDELQFQFEVAAAEENAVTIGISDFVRGPGQLVNLPANTTLGIPVTIKAAEAVRSLEFQIAFDPTMLEVGGVSLGPGMPAGATVVLVDTAPGLVTVELMSTADLPAGEQTVAHLQASVPTANASVTYGRQQLLDLVGIGVSNSAGDLLPIIADDAVHIGAYFADISGNGRVNAADAAQVARAAALLDAGFSGLINSDPLVIADITGNGRLNAADASRVAQFAALIPVAEIPPIPVGVAVTGLEGLWRDRSTEESEGSGLPRRSLRVAELTMRPAVSGQLTESAGLMSIEEEVWRRSEVISPTELEEAISELIGNGGVSRLLR